MALYPRTKKSLKCPAKALSRIQNEPILFTESFQIIELFLQLRVLHASSMKLYFQFVFELNVECACSLTLWSLWQENYSNQHQCSVGVTKNGNLVIKKKEFVIGFYFVLAIWNWTWMCVFFSILWNLTTYSSGSKIWSYELQKIFQFSHYVNVCHSTALSKVCFLIMWYMYKLTETHCVTDSFSHILTVVSP